jgi:hypothetical protein
MAHPHHTAHGTPHTAHRTPATDDPGLFGHRSRSVGTRHQPAARPAARGHYILHSPHDTTADDPSRDRQLDFRVYLAYALTTPAGDDFGSVQRELGIAHEDAIGLQVKDPDVESTNNPRAAGIPRERRAQVSAARDRTNAWIVWSSDHLIV